MNKKAILGLVVLLSLALVGTVAAKRDGYFGKSDKVGKCFHKRGGGKFRFFKSLPEPTKQKIMALRLEKQRQSLPIRAQLKVVGTQLKVELTSDSPSNGKIQSLINQKLALQKKLMVLRAENVLEVAKLLDGKSKTKFKMMILKQGKFGKKRGCGKHFRGGRF